MNGKVGNDAFPPPHSFLDYIIIFYTLYFMESTLKEIAWLHTYHIYL